MLCGDAKSGFAFVQVKLELSEVKDLVAQRDASFTKPDRATIEERGRALCQSDSWSAPQVHQFVEDVFRWGKGTRNLTRVLKSSALPSMLRDCSHAISQGCGTPEAAAIAIWRLVTCVPQLGASFASKLLRFLHPDDVVIFDSIIRLRLGLEETEKAYAFFHGSCRTIQAALIEEGEKLVLSDVEAAIYMKLRKNKI
jgi:hypothetical protein